MHIQRLFFLLCGILSVKGSPVDTVIANGPIESVKPVGVSESNDSIDSLSVEDSVEEMDSSKVPEGRPVVKASVIFQTTSILQSTPIVADILRKVGPVELGLRNVVAASAAATEEIYLGLSAMNAETSHMISSKSEILTAHAMNELFEPLNKVENEIKRTEECGKRYEFALNMIFKDIDVSLRECTKNLTAIDAQYKSDNVGTLTSLSIAAEEMSSLPESCEIAQNFAVGTFCVVNNLAEMNERVLSDVKTIKQNTMFAKEETQKAVTSTEMCQKKLVEKVSEKLNKLLQEIDEKCVLRKP